MTAPLMKHIKVPLTIFFLLGLCACGATIGSSPTPGPTISPTVTPTPTATPIPPAVIVNGEEISQAEFDTELARYQQSQTGMGNTVSTETARQTVMKDTVDTLLLAQGASTYGYTVDDATLQSRIDKLTSQVGGAGALKAWEAAHSYTDVDFRSELRRQIAAAWMRNRVTASVPANADQVHVKQILLYNANDAQLALGDLQTGTIFDDLASQYDPVTKGDLGWFPRGYLPDPAIETAAFALQPGQYSAIIQDETGYHILYLVERDPARPLSPDALLTLQASALQDWLAQRRKESTITYAP
ncbi:MAG TPA: peptidyl-prolyl cis-trans isomerase [Anaerolineales bacterium]